MSAQPCTWVFVLHYAGGTDTPTVSPHATASEAWARAFHIKHDHQDDVVSVVMAGVEYEVEA